MSTTHREGREVPLSAEEQARYDAWRGARIDELRTELGEKVKATAGERVAVLFSRTRADIDLAWAELNTLATVISLIDRDRRAMRNRLAQLAVPPTAEPYPGATMITPEQSSYLDQQLDKWVQILAVRGVESATLAQLAATGTDPRVAPDTRRAALLAVLDGITWP